MKNRFLQLLLGLGIASLFIILSLRGVELDEVIQQIKSISLLWILPYFFVVLASNVIRAERWKMLLDDETGGENSRRVLFSGLMYSYMGNLVLPRAGEFLRAVYSSRHTGIETTKLFGTIVLERIVDALMMVIMLLITFILLVTDPIVLQQIFGDEGAGYIRQITSSKGLFIIGLLGVITLAVLWFLRRRHSMKEAIRSKTPGISGEAGSVNPGEQIEPPKKGFKEWGKDFLRGLISIRKLRNWPLYILYTVLIWLSYVITSLLPFYAFDFHILYDFGWEQAFVITVIGAVGVSMPSPGGIGTYHYMVQSGLSVLYLVPAATALSYATIGHFVNVMCLILVAVVIFLTNTLAERRNKSESIPFSNLFR